MRAFRVAGVAVAAALCGLSGCTFLEAFEITYGDGKYKLPRITTELSIPDLADLGTLSEAELSGQVHGLPADRKDLTLAHVRGALRLAGQCELSGSLRQGISSGRIDTQGSLFSLADCAGDGRCAASCPPGRAGLELRADVRIQLLSEKKAQDIKKKLAEASPDAVRQVRLRFFAFEPFQRIGGTDEAPEREATTAWFEGLSMRVRDDGDGDEPLLDADDLARVAPDTPRRFDLPRDGALVEGILAKLLEGREVWLVLSLRARIPEEALYRLRVEGSGVRVDVQPEMVVSALDAAESL